MGSQICWRHLQGVQQNSSVVVEGDGHQKGEYVHDVFGSFGVVVELAVEPHC